MSYMMYAPTRVLFGAGQLNHLHEQALPGSKALLVISSGKSVRENGALERTIGELAHAGIQTVLFDQVQANPLKSTVMAGTKAERLVGAVAEANRGIRKKQALRCLTDFAMILLVLALMAYSVTGQEVHEWMGVGMFLLFLHHHGLNAPWFRSLTRGRYTPVRVLQTALVLLLLVSVAAQVVSGLAMARFALPFLNIPVSTSTARLLHLACGYWSFLLMGLHLGLHWSIFLGLGRKLRGGQPLPAPGRWGLRILAGAAAIWGTICFVQQNIADYLFLRTEFVFFDYEKLSLLALGELAAIMALWTLIGYLLQRLPMRYGKSSHNKE